SCFFSSRRRHTRSTRDWSSDVCSSDLYHIPQHCCVDVNAHGLPVLHRYVVSPPLKYTGLPSTGSLVCCARYLRLVVAALSTSISGIARTPALALHVQAQVGQPTPVMTPLAV